MSDTLPNLNVESINEINGYPVEAALNCGNLELVNNSRCMPCSDDLELNPTELPVQMTSESAEDTDHPEANGPSKLPQSPFPNVNERPCYVVLDDWKKSIEGNHRPGVYWCGLTAGKKDAPPEPFDMWISSPIHIDAVTFDGQSNNFV